MPKLQVLEAVVVTMLFWILPLKSETVASQTVFVMPSFGILLLNSCKSFIKLALRRVTLSKRVANTITDSFENGVDNIEISWRLQRIVRRQAGP